MSEQTRVSLQLVISDLPLHSYERWENGFWMACQLFGAGEQPVFSVCAPDGRLTASFVPAGLDMSDLHRPGEVWTWEDPWGTEHEYRAESIKLDGHWAHPIFEEETGNMQSAVTAYWPGFIRGREGETNWLYPDTHRLSDGTWNPLPTTGTGNQIGDGKGGISAFGLSLPWKKLSPVNGKSPSDSAIVDSKDWATEAEIKAEWARLKGMGLIGSGFAYEKYATLWLEQSVVDFLLTGKTNENWSALKSGFPDIETWPADAQLAIMDMAWWMGNAFYEKWPKLTSYLKSKNFYGAAANSISKAKAPRDEDHRKMFQNAGSALALNTAAASLWYPKGHDWRPLGAGTPLQTFPTSVSVQALKSAPTGAYSNEGWIVQGMLMDLKFYTLAHDGQFGSQSLKAFSAFCKSKTMPQGITADTVNLLSQESKWYLPAS